MTRKQYEKMTSLIESEKPFLWSQALYIARKREDAEDLYQETIMKVCLFFDSFKGDSNFRAWFRKIMLNIYINGHNKKMSKTQTLDDSNLNRENALTLESRNISNMGNPEEVFFHNHISEEIMNAFNSVPEDFQDIFSLFHFNGYRYSEISRILEIPVGTVKSRIHRAKWILAEKMSNARDS